MTDHDWPDDLATMSNIFTGSRPSFSARPIASQVPSMVMPRIMLLQILAA